MTRKQMQEKYADAMMSMYKATGDDTDVCFDKLVYTMKNLGNPEARVRQMLGVLPGFGRPLGLPDDWGARVIASVGNYGEIFERNLGRASVFGMDRGLNDQWTRGGLMYSFPTR